MKKKQYVKPVAEIVEVEGATILAGSGGGSVTTLGRGSKDDTEEGGWANNPDSNGRLFAD